MPKKVAFIGEHTASFFENLFGRVDPARFSYVPLEKADYVFYSTFSSDHHSVGPDVIKVFICGENICPDFNACDFAITSEYLEYSDRHLRVPVYALYDDLVYLEKRPKLSNKDLSEKKEFCNFIYSNRKLAHPIREEFFHALNAQRPVVSAGRILQNDTSLANNVDPSDWHRSKLNFLRKFRFTIAIENSEHPGYITEKMTDALAAHTVPIYWGDPLVTKEFNQDAFINLRDYSNFSDAIDEIQNLDRDPKRLLNMLNSPFFRAGTNKLVEFKSNAHDFLNAIFQQPLPKARRRPHHGHSLWLEKGRRRDQTGLKRMLKRNRF